MMVETVPSWARRVHPRAPAQAFCSELAEAGSVPALAIDLSEYGLRLQRPLVGRRMPGPIQLEFELPEVDEIVWASGEVCFDELWQVRKGGPGLSGWLRTTGVHLRSMTARHRRMLREFAHDYAGPEVGSASFADFAACYRYG